MCSFASWADALLWQKADFLSSIVWWRFLYSRWNWNTWNLSCGMLYVIMMALVKSETVRSVGWRFTIASAMIELIRLVLGHPGALDFVESKRVRVSPSIRVRKERITDTARTASLLTDNIIRKKQRKLKIEYYTQFNKVSYYRAGSNRYLLEAI